MYVVQETPFFIDWSVKSVILTSLLKSSLCQLHMYFNVSEIRFVLNKSAPSLLSILHELFDSMNKKTW